jgi:hypothetical protein
VTDIDISKFLLVQIIFASHPPIFFFLTMCSGDLDLSPNTKASMHTAKEDPQYIKD